MDETQTGNIEIRKGHVGILQVFHLIKNGFIVLDAETRDLLESMVNN